MEPPRRRSRPSPAPLSSPSTGSRRAFLLQTLATATVGSLWIQGLGPEGAGGPFPRRRVRPTAPGDAPANLEPGAFATLGAMMDRLLPSGEGEPGARDVNAILYLDAVFGASDVDPALLARVREGARRMDAHARALGATEGPDGSSAYASLGTDEQDAGLHALEAAWEDELILRALLAFTLEAFLGDPVDGANPEGIGWTWAEHRPGYPRPASKGPVPATGR